MEHVIANNLRRFRKEKHINQQDLAEKAGLSRSGYANIEQGKTVPRPSNLKALARALNVHLKEILTPVRQLSKVRFRSLKRLKSREQVLADVACWLGDFSDLEKILDEFEECGLESIWKELSKIEQPEIPAIAASMRNHFGLSEKEPVHDICGLLESQGIKVFSVCVANDAFMGLSVAKEDGGPAIIVNTWGRLPVETWIFSAAHELAHLILHIGAYDVNQDQEDKLQENQADEFASHFLMPEAAFKKEWQDAAGLPLIDRVFKVKRVFRVSWRTVIYRVSLALPTDERGKLWQQFSKLYKQRGGRSLLKHDEPNAISKEIYQSPHPLQNIGHEPASMVQSDFQSDRLSRLVRMAVEQDAISMSRGAEILQIPLEEMRDLSACWMA